MPSWAAKNCIKEKAKYIGNFSAGKRDGYGCMYLADSSNYEDIWKNYMRH